MAVKKFNLPNYLGARVPVQSQLKVENWKRLLKGYHFDRILDYIEYGFPVSLDYSNFKYNTQIKNHSSALAFPSAVDQYFETETSLQAIAGPFTEQPFKLCHFSPLMSRA